MGHAMEEDGHATQELKVEPSARRPHIHEHGQANGTTARDPVCGMTVDQHTTPHRHAHHAHTYYFCSAGCRTKFAAHPDKYLSSAEPAAEPVPAGAIYTCPMHPQIRQPGPGACPICGMALEPEVAAPEGGSNPELADMTRRFWIALLLTAPVFALDMGAHLTGGHGFVDPTLSGWIQLAFSTPVALWAGAPFFVRGFQSLRTRNLNMFTLIALGTGVAYVYSVVATVAPTLFPTELRGHDGTVALYFEAAAVITVLVLLGQ
jgi:P-type Cu+ transporter